MKLINNASFHKFEVNRRNYRYLDLVILLEKYKSIIGHISTLSTNLGALSTSLLAYIQSIIV